MDTKWIDVLQDAAITVDGSDQGPASVALGEMCGEIEDLRARLAAAEREKAGKCPHCGGSGPPHLGCAQHVEMIRKTFIGSYQREVDDLRARLAAAEQDWWDLYAEKLTVMDDLRRRAEMAERERDEWRGRFEELRRVCNGDSDTIREQGNRLAKLEAAERERDEEEEIVWKTVCDACNEFLPQPALYDHSPVELIYRIGEQRDEFQQRLATLEAAVREVADQLAEWRHYECEESWYSCKQNVDCCHPERGGPCDCGAARAHSIACALRAALDWEAK